jgi:hypothetical protein
VTPWAPRTGANLIVEQLARWDDRIVATLAASNWEAGPRRFVAYDLRDGRVVWQSPARLKGLVNVVASDANTILVGGAVQ